MFRERLLSSLVFVPVVAVAFHLGGPCFTVLIAAIAVVGALEYRNLMAVAGVPVHASFVPVCALVAVSGYLAPSLFVAALLGGAVLVLSVALLWTGSAPSAMYSLSGEVYVGGLLGALALLRAGPSGWSWAFLTLLCTWATDVGAYLGGIAWGKHKLAPSVSPSKSWEGAIFGILSSGLVGGIISRPMSFPVHFAVAAGIALGILAEMGDLVESSLKRFAKLKDSGKIIPGHGGILDRFDSLLFTGAGGLLMRAMHRILFS